MSSSSSSDDEGGKFGEFEKALQDVGVKLHRRNSSTDELMIYLEEAESLLRQVVQMPPKHTANSLYFIMISLIKDKFVEHTDLDVQVAVASCLHEITRISAPADPYKEEDMKKFFKLVNVALKQLSCKSGPNFSRALEILDTMSKVRSCLMMVDLDDALVVEMFATLFEVISSDHEPEVFEYMETIMTTVIEESDEVDEISFELLSTLLDSLKKENKNTSPISWELGKKVLENCEAQLEPYVKKALKAKKLNLDDYDEIITSLCKDTPRGEKRVANGPTALETEENPAPQSNGESGNIVQSETDTLATRSKRRIKPTYKIRPDEIYEHPWMKQGKNSREVSSDGNNDKKDSSLRQSRQSKMKHNDTKGKEIMVEIISKKDKSKDDINKMVESSVSKPAKEKEKMVESSGSKPAKDKDPKKEKEKKRRRPSGEKLVNSRIQVWWPKDKTFYTGTVVDYDVESKKHTVYYDDNQIEVLTLKKERWEFIDDNKSPVTKPAVEEQDIDRPSTSKEPAKINEKSAKRKAGPSKKREATSSSKRLKNENRSVAKSGKNSKRDFVNVGDEANDERRETNVSTKDDGYDRVVIKDEPVN